MEAIAKSMCVMIYDEDTGMILNCLFIQNIIIKKKKKNEFFSSLILHKICTLMLADYSSRIVHIGAPKMGFFSEPSNATIIVASEGNLEQHLNLIETANSVLLLEDSR